MRRGATSRHVSTSDEPRRERGADEDRREPRVGAEVDARRVSRGRRGPCIHTNEAIARPAPRATRRAATRCAAATIGRRTAAARPGRTAPRSRGSTCARAATAPEQRPVVVAAEDRRASSRRSRASRARRRGSSRARRGFATTHGVQRDAERRAPPAAPGAGAGRAGPRTRRARSRPVRAPSASSSDVIRKPDSTKNTSTPR